MTCIDCIKYDACVVYNGGMTRTMSMKNKAEEMCKLFKNKADFVEVVRCEKCKHGEVSCYEKTVDGEEYTGCYCKLKNAVMDVEHYCSYGDKK